jgi:ABC-type uncharacterized transport system involved in gliding motility auxiliary subunit
MDYFIKLCQKIRLSVWIIAVFISFNILAFVIFSGMFFDATNEEKFSISDATRDMVSHLKEPMDMTLYVSDVVTTEFPSLKNYSVQVKDFLTALSEQSGGKIRFKTILVESYSVLEDKAVALGLTALPHSDGRSVFFGVVAENMLDGVGVLPFLSPEREAMLEFDIAQLIDGVSKKAKTRIALASSLPLSVGAEGLGAIRSGNIKPFAIYNELQSRYDVMNLSGNFKELTQNNPPPVTLLLHPYPMNKTAKQNIQNYLASGGRVIAAIDPLSELPVPDVPNNTLATVMSSSLGTMLNDYGVVYDSDMIVLDKSMARRGRDPETGKPHDYIAWLKPTKDFINQSEPALSYINELSMGTVGALERDKNYKGSLEFTPLIVSSKNADSLSVKQLLSTSNIADVEKNYIPRRQFIMAAKIQGQFPESVTSQTQKTAITPKKSAMIVVADSDFLDDRFWINALTPEQQAALGGRMMAAYADNGYFLLNMIDYLSGDSALIALRGRNTQKYPLDYIDNIKKQAQSNFLEQEQKLNQEIIDLNKKIQTIKSGESAKTPNSNLNLGQNIQEFTKKLLLSREQLRHVKRNMNETLDKTELQIKLMNTVIFPLLIGLIPVIFLMIRRSRHYKMRPVQEQHLNDDADNSDIRE